MKKYLSFDDVLIVPKFSYVESRNDVSLETQFCGLKLKLPIISSNMDTVTGARMASAMSVHGGVGALHRFNSIFDNVSEFISAIDMSVQSGIISNVKPMVSVGLGDKEYQRALALVEAGATHIIIDVAHGAAINVVRQYDKLRSRLNDDVYIIVGNFATAQSIWDFNDHVQSERKPDAYKVGIGPGSLCTTRVVTGCGLPNLGSIIDCSETGFPIIADGGIRTSGDMAKALAAGASVVMLGGLLAGADEAPGEVVWQNRLGDYLKDTDVFPLKENKDGTLTLDTENYPCSLPSFKKYRGSASKESYEVQDKVSSYRTPEGEMTYVPYKGYVKDILQQLEAGVKSSLSYSGVYNLSKFREVELAEITSSGARESEAHGKK